MIRKRQETAIQDKYFLKLFAKDKIEIIKEEVMYFQNRPDEIDEITAPLNVQK